MAFDFDLVVGDVAEVVEVPGGLAALAGAVRTANVTIGKERSAGRKLSRHQS